MTGTPTPLSEPDREAGRDPEAERDREAGRARDGEGELRPRRRGVWIFLAVVTALVVIAPAGLYAFGRAVRQTAESVTPYHVAIKELRLDMDDAEVSVGPGAEGEARVYQRLTWGLHKPAVTESLVEDVLFITFRCSRVGPVIGRECGADVDVRVPPGVRVSAVTGSGRVVVRGLAGDLDLRTGSGELQVADVRGRLRLQARSGEISATGLASPKVVAEASSGSLDLRFAEPPDLVTAIVHSGSAKVLVPPGSQYQVLGWTGSGSAHLNPAVVDDASPRRISVQNNSGSSYIDYRDD
ncbi:DUF4097 domain-containing protein [Actinomadura syzygii]|uniref:DUF4097 domain-containing protein n=1 Tax=Actinomadura syzygii TaxID=1427538 RepID=A0A5D0TU01_9ACTN|nr:DUF4097 domain-containing protein [Actinomadura syzygii]TYC08309.1 DUF4097 domain-containing protein [Actinomadura syzygii]